MPPNPKNNNLGALLKNITGQLTDAGISSARLDALILIEDISGKDRAWILANPEYQLSPDQLADLEVTVKKREKRIPIAYIRGRQEFYGRVFKVDSRVLIPRPETEAIIELLKNLPIKEGDLLVDIGTGSGNIGITSALELPALHVYLNDIDDGALKVANDNAKQLAATISIASGDFEPWVKKLTPRFITANLPYLSDDVMASPETAHEPDIALYAKDSGLELIKRLVKSWEESRSDSSYLLLEFEPSQHEEIITFAAQSMCCAKSGFCIVLANY